MSRPPYLPLLLLLPPLLQVAGGDGLRQPPHRSVAVSLEDNSLSCGSSKQASVACHGSSLGLLQTSARPASSSISSSVGRSGRAARGDLEAPLPSVYVYDLPQSAEDGRGGTILVRNNFDGIQSLSPQLDAAGVYDEREYDSIFGEIFEIEVPGRSGRKVRLRNSSQFALGSIIYASLLRWPNRTQDPHTADLFFVPLLRRNESDCPTAEWLVSRLAHLNGDTASRHILVSASTGWAGSTCKAFQARQSGSTSAAEQVLARTSKLALEDRSSGGYPSGWVDDLLGSEQRRPTRPPVADNLHSIPYPSVLNGMDSAAIEAWRAAVRAAKRDYLASAIFNTEHGMGSSIRVREELAEQCDRDPGCMFVGDLSKKVSANDVVMATKLRSTFCLEPTGDTPSRKGLVDSLLAGCIPVLSDPLQARLWPWHVGQWEDVSLELNGANVEDIDVMSWLAAVPPAEIARLRANIDQITDRLVYRSPGYPVPGSALEIILDHVLNISASE